MKSIPELRRLSCLQIWAAPAIAKIPEGARPRALLSGASGEAPYAEAKQAFLRDACGSAAAGPAIAKIPEGAHPRALSPVGPGGSVRRATEGFRAGLQPGSPPATTIARWSSPHGWRRWSCSCRPDGLPVRAAVVALRPRQWLKNLLLFAGIIFAAQLGDPVRWLQAVAAFVAYCAASSAAYLVNDLRDVCCRPAAPGQAETSDRRGELRAPHRRRARCALAIGAAPRDGVPRPRVARLPARIRSAPGGIHAASQARRPRRRARDRRAVRHPRRQPARSQSTYRSRRGCSSARASWRCSSRSGSDARSSCSSGQNALPAVRCSRATGWHSSISCSRPSPGRRSSPTRSTP